jgi:hypothetical protein
MSVIGRIPMSWRLGRMLAAAIAVGLGASGCSSAPRATTPTPVGLPLPTPISAGLLVGGLEPCSGIFLPTLPFAAGTIVVLRGTRSADGALPTTIVAAQTVPSGGQFRFSLPPGQYVLVGHYTEPTVIAPWVSVTVTAATTTTQDIPNRCV